MDTAKESPRSPAAVELGGEIDLNNAGNIGDDLCVAVHRSNGEALTVDLSEVSFIDSTAIAMMLRVHGYAETWRKTVVWLDAQPQASTVFRLTGVDSVLNLE